MKIHGPFSSCLLVRRCRAETRNSRLQRPLMEYLVALVKRHKGEVAAALGTDPTLQVLLPSQRGPYLGPYLGPYIAPI